jgi:hypothetical protein
MAIMIICAIITHSNVYVPREQYEKTIFAIKLCGGEAHSIIINLALPKRFLFIFLSLLFVCAACLCYSTTWAFLFAKRCQKLQPFCEAQKLFNVEDKSFKLVLADELDILGWF